jgi:hypothetical protein
LNDQKALEIHTLPSFEDDASRGQWLEERHVISSSWYTVGWNPSIGLSTSQKTRSSVVKPLGGAFCLTLGMST